MIAAYCSTYGPLPEGISYARFMSMVLRVPRFAARHTLSHLRGTLAAIGAAFGGGLEAQQIEDELDRIAYPRKSGAEKGPRMALIQSNREEAEPDGG